jgi:hypothetical protein
VRRNCNGMYTIGDSDVLPVSLLQESNAEIRSCLPSFHASAVKVYYVPVLFILCFLALRTIKLLSYHVTRLGAYRYQEAKLVQASVTAYQVPPTASGKRISCIWQEQPAPRHGDPRST